MSAQVINFGSINIDYIYQVPHFVMPGETLASNQLNTVLGGKGANQSVAVASAGATVAHSGQIGVADQWAIAELQQYGVDTHGIKTVTEKSGHAVIQVDQQGENAIVLYGGANLNCQLEDLEASLTKHHKAQYLLLQNECNLLPQAIDVGHKYGLKIILNPAPMSNNINDLDFEKVDILIVNQGEAQQLSECATEETGWEVLAARFKNLQLVITRGADGALMLNHGQRIASPAPRVKPIDTTGAGDTFVGYFVAGCVTGLDALANMQRACHAAALATTKLGALHSIPRLSELDYA